MKDAYVEREWPRYMAFGTHQNGMVDIIRTGADDLVATVNAADAERLINDRNALVQRLCDMAWEFDRVAPDAFTKFWYGPNPTSSPTPPHSPENTA